MKKYLFGLLATAIAVISFAFTSQKLSEGPNCEDATIYWFKVDPSVNKACNSIAQSELLTIIDANANGLPDEVPQGEAIDAPHGCLDEVQVACALGFVYSSTPSQSQVERVQIGSNFVFRPKSTEVANYQCCVKKNVE